MLKHPPFASLFLAPFLFACGSTPPIDEGSLDAGLPDTQDAFLPDAVLGPVDGGTAGGDAADTRDAESFDTQSRDAQSRDAESRDAFPEDTAIVDARIGGDAASDASDNLDASDASDASHDADAAATADASSHDGGVGSPARFEEVENFGRNPGELKMFLFVPSNLPQGPRPLVVALHGCSQNAREYHENAGFSDMAEERKFVVVYAEQQTRNNFNRCFNWFRPDDITRGDGESESIAEMVAHVQNTQAIDETKVFVTGVSAGGFMTVVMAATHPDIFAGAIVNAGGPYRCAESAVEGFSCMRGQDETPAAWANRLVQTNGFAESSSMRWPQILIWHGSSDRLVGIKNLEENMEQWTTLHGVDQTPDRTQTLGGNTTVHEYWNSTGTPVVVTYSTAGMDHAVQVDPRQGCGATGTQYYADVGVCTAREMVRFFNLLP